MKDKPAGWYRNAGDRRQHGYWDGLAWDEPAAEVPPEQADVLSEDVDAGDFDYSD